MKKESWIFLFAIVFGAGIAAIQENNELLKFIFKPMIVLSLIGYFVTATNVITNRLKHWIIIALIFSWFGDVLLMFEPKGPLFFILGLSAFLIAHLFYILFFHQVRLQQSISGKPLLLILVAVLRRLDLLWEETEELYRSSTVSPQLLEIRNMITVGYLIVKGAGFRKESRGLHYNTDYPNKSKLVQNIVL